MAGKIETRTQARKRMILAAEDFSLVIQEGQWLDWYEATAFHEAGHAIAAAVLGLPFDHVSILPDDLGRSDGRILLRKTWRDWLYEHPQSGSDGGIHLALKDGLALMAGLAAELRWSGGDVDLRSAGVGDRDELQLLSTSILMQIYPHKGMSALIEEQVIQRWAWREACLMMANPRVWAAIERLSLHLIQDETASEAEVIEMVSEMGVRYQPTLLHLSRASLRAAEGGQPQWTRMEHLAPCAY